MSEQLKPCPCGEVPTRLYTSECGVYGAMTAHGDCCGDWSVGPFDSQGLYGGDVRLKALAVQAWNSAPRSKE